MKNALMAPRGRAREFYRGSRRNLARDVVSRMVFGRPPWVSPSAGGRRLFALLWPAACWAYRRAISVGDSIALSFSSRTWYGPFPVILLFYLLVTPEIRGQRDSHPCGRRTVPVSSHPPSRVLVWARFAGHRKARHLSLRCPRAVFWAYSPACLQSDPLGLFNEWIPNRPQLFRVVVFVNTRASFALSATDHGYPVAATMWPRRKTRGESP